MLKIVNKHTSADGIVFILLFLFMYSPLCLSQEKILTVVSDNIPIYEKFNNILKSYINSSILLDMIDITELNQIDFNKYDRVVSIGTDASEILSRTTNIKHIIYTLIPSVQSKRLKQRACRAESCQYIVIDQPEERYFRLVKAISSNRTLVVAKSQQSNIDVAKLSKIAKNYNIRFRVIHIPNANNISGVLARHLDRNHILLALPDPVIYNRYTAKSIILSAYHKNVPIVAYSKSFTKAGALISIYSSIDNIAQQTAKVVSNNEEYIDDEYYSDDFTIEVNNSVSKSLEISIDNIQELKKIIK